MLRKVCQGIVSTKPVSVGVDTASVIRDGNFILDWHPKASRVRTYLNALRIKTVLVLLQVILGLPSGDLKNTCAPALGEVLSLMVRENDKDIKPLLEPFRLQRASLQENLLEFGSERE